MGKNLKVRVAGQARLLLLNVAAEVEGRANGEACGPAAVRQQIAEQMIVDDVRLHANCEVL